MAQTSTRYRIGTSQLAGHRGPVKEHDAERDSVPKETLPYRDPNIIVIVRADFVCWYTWTVSVNFQQDDLVVLIFSSLVLLTELVKSNPKTIQKLKIN